jgi:hypothetical protein
MIEKSTHLFQIDWFCINTIHVLSHNYGKTSLQKFQIYISKFIDGKKHEIQIF